MLLSKATYNTLLLQGPPIPLEQPREQSLAEWHCWLRRWLRRSNQQPSSYQFSGLSHYTTKVIMQQQKLDQHISKPMKLTLARNRKLTTWIVKRFNLFKCFTGSRAHGDQAHKCLEQTQRQPDVVPHVLPLLPQGCGVQEGCHHCFPRLLAEWCPHWEEQEHAIT